MSSNAGVSELKKKKKRLSDSCASLLAFNNLLVSSSAARRRSLLRVKAEQQRYDQASVSMHVLQHSQHNLNLWVCKDCPTPEATSSPCHANKAGVMLPLKRHGSQRLLTRAGDTKCVKSCVCGIFVFCRCMQVCISRFHSTSIYLISEST